MAGTRAENYPSFARSAVLHPISGHRDHLAAPGLQRVVALIGNDDASGLAPSSSHCLGSLQFGNRALHAFALSPASFSRSACGMNRIYAFSIIARLVPVWCPTVSGSTLKTCSTVH
jgi:hypothetical protein